MAEIPICRDGRTWNLRRTTAKASSMAEALRAGSTKGSYWQMRRRALCTYDAKDTPVGDTDKHSQGTLGAFYIYGVLYIWGLYD